MSRAFSPIDRMHMRIGYPAAWRGYAHLQLEGLPLVRKIFATSSLKVEHELAKIAGKIVHSMEWPWNYPPYEAAAVYRRNTNGIFVSAGMFPLLDPAADDAVRYARISLIAHNSLMLSIPSAGHMMLTVT